MLPSNQSGHSLWRKQAPHLPCSLLSHEFSLPAFFSSLNTLSVPHSVSSMGFQFHLRKLMHHGNPKPSPPQQSPVVTQPLPFPNKPSPEIHHINIHAIHIALIFMACMVGVVMLLYIVSITLRNYYSRRHNYNHSRRNTPILFDVNGDSPDDDDDVERFTDHPIWYIRTVGLQQSMIDSITVFKYRKNEGLIDGTECSVCLGEFQEDESLRLLPKCSHAFHIPCIDTWLRSHKNCPLCRAPVVSDGNSNATEVRVTVTDQHGSNVSGDETQNQETHIENFDGVAVEGSGSYHVGEFESIGNDDDDDDDDDDSGKILPVRRSVSMDSSSTSEIFRDVVETHFGGKINSSSKDVSVTIGKHGSGKFKRALQKKPVSMRRSFSHNRKFLFSRHCRSQSSTLPL